VRDFMLNEIRFRALKNLFPDHAEKLYAQAEQEAKERWELYRRLAED